MSRLICCALALGIFSTPAMAQGDAMIEMYGEGVHRFNAGDYLGATQILSQVVDSGTMDPRAYYFRGLAQEMQGGDGQADYEVGARLEAEGKLVVNVGMALTRIQGATRTKIELARRAARVIALQEKIMSDRAQLSAPPANLAAPPTPSQTGPSGDAGALGDAAPADLFSDGGLRSEETILDPSQPAVEPMPDAATNPFGDDNAPPPTAETPSPPPADNPFGTGNADPFGTTPGAAAPADAADPFGTTPGSATPGSAAPSGAADPFGTPGGSSDSGVPSDPFGTPGGGAGAGAADPFGGASDPFGSGN